MLLNRSKQDLEASMEHAVFRVREIPHIVDSFLYAQHQISAGSLEELLASLNKLQGVAFNDSFKEEDFNGAVLMTESNVLLPYAVATGFYPYAIGFIFSNFKPIIRKVLHRPTEARGFYVAKASFTRPPFSDTGVVFVDGRDLRRTFIHYEELTSSTQFQYAKSHQLEYFDGPRVLRKAYELELMLLREAISIYVKNKEAARFLGKGLGPFWYEFWDSLKREFHNKYLPVYKRMVEQAGGTTPRDLELDVKRKIDAVFDLMKSLLHRNTREIVDIFFRFGTMPHHIQEGRLYSPLNDAVTYFNR